MEAWASEFRRELRDGSLLAKWWDTITEKWENSLFDGKIVLRMKYEQSGLDTRGLSHKGRHLPQIHPYNQGKQYNDNP